MQMLTLNQIDIVSGGDRGDAAVAGALGLGAAGWATLRGAAWGARLGAFAGPVGALGGAVVGAIAGAAIYEVFDED